MLKSGLSSSDWGTSQALGWGTVRAELPSFPTCLVADESLGRSSTWASNARLVPTLLPHCGQAQMPGEAEGRPPRPGASLLLGGPHLLLHL